MFYEFDQNNSGGHFVVNDDVCHRLFIEADNEREALWKAEDLGCYWDGVSKGMDCSCCGDRWCQYAEEVNLLDFATNGYIVSVYDGCGDDPVEEWNRRYGKFKVVTEPKFEKTRSLTRYEGTICFRDIEEYAQYLADEYGWTSPDARIFYKDGLVKEIYKSNEKVRDEGE